VDVFSKFRWLGWLVAIVMFGNFAALMAYGDTLRSTHLFIVRGTVFYPVAITNLVLGIVLVTVLIWEMFRKTK
jgi:uncharacterized membrane protein (DUF485 family)